MLCSKINSKSSSQSKLTNPIKPKSLFRNIYLSEVTLELSQFFSFSVNCQVTTIHFHDKNNEELQINRKTPLHSHY